MIEKVVSEGQLRNKTIFAFAFFVIAICAAWLLWKGLRSQPLDAGTPKVLRKGFEANEAIFGGLFSADRKVKTFAISEAEKNVRVNGNFGLKDPGFNPATWKLRVVKSAGDTLLITLDELKALPKTDVVFDFKCIEGWSQKTWWSGVTFADFVKHYHLEKEIDKSYAALVTPDKGYYVGVDMPSMKQSQTILCYEMNGQPLPMNQGYPLRLIIPVKYGIKHLKRIGTMSFSNARPPDYWAEKGYDYYSGH